MRYTLIYKGYLFEGDNAFGWNFHDYADWGEVAAIYNFYGVYSDLSMEIRDNEYGVNFNGEWY